MAYMHSFAVEIPELPRAWIEGQVEVTTRGDEVIFGDVELMTGHHVVADRLVFDYAPIAENLLGKTLAIAIRRALEADKELCADAWAGARETERETALLRRAEQRETWL